MAEQVAVIKTGMGTMVVKFRADKAPGHVENFVKLANDGFYNGLIFHRIIPNFMVQGGCPDGTGTGGPGHNIKAEFNDLKHVPGVLSMARSGDPDSAGSQFFICLSAYPSLDGQYTGFGELIEGMEVLEAIGKVEIGQNDRPAEDVKMESVTIEEREL